MHRFALDGIDDQNDQPVVQQQPVAGFHVARQILVVEADAVDIAWLDAPCIENELGAWLQPDLAVLELADADFGTLQVGHDGHLAAGTARCLAHHDGPVDVVLRGAVAEVEPHDADLVQDHLLQHLGCAGSRTEGRDNFRGVAWQADGVHGMSPEV